MVGGVGGVAAPRSLVGRTERRPETRDRVRVGPSRHSTNPDRSDPVTFHRDRTPRFTRAAVQSFGRPATGRKE